MHAATFHTNAVLHITQITTNHNRYSIVNNTFILIIEFALTRNNKSGCVSINNDNKRKTK